jgi:hypothetical protein
MKENSGIVEDAETRDIGIEPSRSTISLEQLEKVMRT